jgi:TPR repeat protein
VKRAYKFTAMAQVVMACLLSFCVGPLLAQSVAASSRSADANASAVAADAAMYCPPGLESLLPGDYYACEARHYFGTNKVGHMVDELTEAAYWANKDAQHVLGLIYFNGDMPGVAQNRPLGLAWLSLAAERKNIGYVNDYAIARAHATADEITQSEQLLSRMRDKYGDQVAGVRAVRAFNRAVREIDDAAMYGGIVYYSGFSFGSETALTLSRRLHNEADNDFSDLHGTVTVGEPAWAAMGKGASTQPAAATSTSKP